MKKIKGSKIEFEISIKPERVKEFYDQAAKNLSQNIEIKGFRKGMVPKDVLIAKVGEAPLFEEAAYLALEKEYINFIQENDVYPVDNPQIEVKKIAPENPFEVKVVVAVYPDVVLPDYNKIIDEESKKRERKFDVSDDELNASLDYLLNSRAKENRVEREAKKGDLVEVDFEVRKDGVKLEGGESRNHPVKIGDGKFIPGFEDELVGLKEGDKKSFSLTAPKDYFKKDLAGKKLDFKVKVNAVFEIQKPELTDEFAKSLGDFKTVDDLKKSVKEGIEMEKKEKERNEYLDKVLKRIVEESEIDLPDVLVEKEAEKMLDEFRYDVESHGVNFGDYLASLKKTEDDFKNGLKGQAELRLKKSMVISEIAKKEKLEATEDEIQNKANELLSRFTSVEDAKKNVNPDDLRAYSKMLIINDKVFNLLDKEK